MRCGKVYPAAVFSKDYSGGTIFRDKQVYAQGGLSSLTTFASDQVFLASVLASRQACYLHAGGINIDGKGLLFVGHSEAGKSTMPSCFDSMVKSCATTASSQCAAGRKASAFTAPGAAANCRMSPLNNAHLKPSFT